MKKCPSCDREFDDAMRFCQTDGTPLVDAAPPVDPYKTMVARPEDIAAAIPSAPVTVEPEPVEEDVLQIPPAESDPKKTMYASEDEIRSAMAEVDGSREPVMDLSPPTPSFIEEEAKPEWHKISVQEDAELAASKTTPPIPSPFGTPPPAEIEQPPPFSAPEPEPPVFMQPEPPAPSFNPFNEPAPIAQADFSPTPAAPEQSRQPEEMQNPQYQPGSGLPAAGGQSKVMPIVSLVFGILSLCCYVAPITGLVALITGFLGMKNANNDPANYGGKGLAIAGMVMGGLFFLVGIAYYIFFLFFGGMAMMMDMMNQAR